MALTNVYSAPVPMTVSIANGAATTTEIDLEDRVLCGIQLPTMTSTTLTITMSTATGGTFTTVRKNGADYSETITSSKYIILDPAYFWGCRFIKVVVGSNEGGARSLILQTVKRV